MMLHCTGAPSLAPLSRKSTGNGAGRLLPARSVSPQLVTGPKPTCHTQASPGDPPPHLCSSCTHARTHAWHLFAPGATHSGPTGPPRQAQRATCCPPPPCQPPLLDPSCTHACQLPLLDPACMHARMQVGRHASLLFLTPRICMRAGPPACQMSIQTGCPPRLPRLPHHHLHRRAK